MFTKNNSALAERQIITSTCQQGLTIIKEETHSPVNKNGCSQSLPLAVVLV